jgi:hypothetical protein
MTEKIIEGAKRLLFSKKQAYDALFDPKIPDAKIVLKDLAEFCRADQTCFHADPRLHAVLEGRREVWLRIQKYINLNPDELWEVTRKD